MAKVMRILKELDVKARVSYKGYEVGKSINILEWSSKKYDYLAPCITKKKQLVYRGEVYWVELGENLGSEESKLRPCVIIQNQLGNKHSPTTLVAPITNATIKLPIAVEISRGDNPDVTGTIDCGQIRVVSKGRIKGRITKLSTGETKKVNEALLKSLGIYDVKKQLICSKQKIDSLNKEIQKKDSEIQALIKENETLKK